MRPFLLSFLLLLLVASPLKAQVSLDLRSPDKQKYITSGAVVGGVSYSLFYDYFKVRSYPYNSRKVKQKAFLSSLATVVGIGIVKEAYDFQRANYNIHADDYGKDLAIALLGAMSVNLTIQLFH